MSSKAYFNQVALKWDQMQESCFSETVREKVFSVAGIQTGKMAADIGAGIGFIYEGLIRRGLHVIVVDQPEAHFYRRPNPESIFYCPASGFPKTPG